MPSSGDSSHLRTTLVFLLPKAFYYRKAGIVSFNLNWSVTRTGAAPHDNAAAVLQLPAEIYWTHSKTFCKYESSTQQYVYTGNFPFRPSSSPDKNVWSETKIICLTISMMSGITFFFLDIYSRYMQLLITQSGQNLHLKQKTSLIM